MRTVGADPLAELRRSRPDFLGWLDTKPERALEAIFNTVYPYLMASPTRAMRWFPADRRHDLVADVLMHLIENNFQRLRKYQDKGRPFLGWLVIVADNKVKSIWLRGRHIDAIEGPTEELPEKPDKIYDSTDRVLNKVVADRVREVIFSFKSGLCFQLLVWRLVYEYTNKEMTVALGWESHRNAEVGNLFGRCLQKLRTRLKAVGIDTTTLSLVAEE